jgi:hypothetical protein
LEPLRPAGVEGEQGKLEAADNRRWVFCQVTPPQGLSALASWHIHEWT